MNSDVLSEILLFLDPCDYMADIKNETFSRGFVGAFGADMLAQAYGIVKRDMLYLGRCINSGMAVGRWSLSGRNVQRKIGKHGIDSLQTKNEKIERSGARNTFDRGIITGPILGSPFQDQSSCEAVVLLSRYIDVANGRERDMIKPRSIIEQISAHKMFSVDVVDSPITYYFIQIDDTIEYMGYCRSGRYYYINGDESIALEKIWHLLESHITAKRFPAVY